MAGSRLHFTRSSHLLLEVTRLECVCNSSVRFAERLRRFSRWNGAWRSAEACSQSGSYWERVSARLLGGLVGVVAEEGPRGDPM